jgi:hypothetical protein
MLLRLKQSNIYAYEKGEFVVKILFYGAKNISQSKLGYDYILPEVK